MNKALVPTTPALEGELVEYSYLELLGRVKMALDSAKEIAVPANNIRPYPSQPRDYFDESHIAGLAKSIDAGGQTTRGMIRFKPGATQYELIDGECRWRGIMRIPPERRPLYKADLIEANDDVVQYLIAGVANFNRRGHTSLEVTRTIERLVSFKLPMQEIASLLGISVMWAEQMYGLRKLSKEVLAMLDPKLPRPQQLPVTAAIQISKIDPDYQLGLANRVLRGDITLSRLRGEVVKTATKAGVKIRLRDVRPYRKWESFGNKVDIISRTAEDVHVLITKGDIDKFVRSDPAVTTKLLRKLEQSRNTISTVESLLRQSRR